MSMYRKKPVVIEARQFYGTKASAEEIKDWGKGWGAKMSDGLLISEGRTPTLDIETLEGTVFATPGDWIIKGIQNEFYPCKPDIFEQTYEPVADALKGGQ